MRLHILETLLHEAVKVSRYEDIRERPLLDVVQQSLAYAEEEGDATQSERDALEFLRRLRDPKFQKDLDKAIQIIDNTIQFSKQ